jgi:rubredoxin---NAD+ reductase
MSGPVVIIGSGLAGHSLARELRKLDAARPITLVTADAGEIYAKPSLSVALAQGRLPDEIPNASAARFAQQQRVTMCTHTRVRAIRPDASRIDTDGGPIAYGQLVLALGASQIPLPGLVGDDRVFSVNSLDDYRRFRAALEGCRRVLVIGAGFIGCEFANDLRQAGVEVDVVDLAPHALARFWPPALARVFEAHLAAAGVCWHLGTRIINLRRLDAGVAATLGDGSVLQADLVLSALGLAPCTELARAAGLKVRRGVAVDEQLATSAPAIHAIGDCAEIEDRLWPFVMPILHCARALARTLTGTPTPVVFPPMPVVLKTPACPAVFLPAAPGTTGEWSIEDECAVLLGPDGAPAGVALLGAAVARRDEWVRRLGAPQPALSM